MALSITNYYNIKKKYNYKEHSRVEQRSWDEIDKFLNLHQIKFSGFDLPKPIFFLDEINFPDFIIDELKLQGILRPTAIQSMTWPSLYCGRDIMCIGLPTSSRVIGYICPALVFVKEQSIEVRKSGALVLICTQTKEVAKEILTQSQMFMHQASCTFCCLFDDENIGTQALHLREHEPDIIIGNYHRLCEMLDNDLVNLKNVAFLIMDDFYRNRSARLSDEIKRVVNETRSERQTAIFSRIVPSGLQKSNGDEFQNDAVFVCIGNDDIHVSHKELPQTIHICTMAEKKKKLQDIITEISQQQQDNRNFKILVYANGFKKIRITEKIIKELGIDTFAYERTNVGKRRRAMKEKVYYNFNATPNSVLVASDVVSSKVDLPELNYIINADFPVNLSLYLNRMRMPNIKRYISIFIAEDARHADRLIYVLNECRQQVPTILYKISEAYTNSGKDVDRMPSLQEINDGLTKPVEKPIPKPLPPTVSLETDSSLKAKRQLEAAAAAAVASTSTTESDPSIKTSVSSSSTSSFASLSPNEAISSSSSLTSSISATRPTTSNYGYISNSSSASSSSSSSSSSISSSSSATSFKRFKALHSNTNSHSHSSNHYQNSSKSVNYNNNNNNSPSVNPFTNPTAPPMHYAISHATMPPSHYNPVLNHPVYSSYQNNQQHQQQNFFQHPNNSYYTNPNLYGQAQFTATVNPQLQQQEAAFIYHQQQLQQQQQQQLQQQRHHELLIQQQQMQNQQYYTSSQTQIIQPKCEPTDHHHHTTAINNSINPHFTNPLPFKIEPKEEPFTSSSTHSTTNNNTMANGNTDNNNSDTNGFQIVSQLLRDKQILSQLEKVAQSFRIN